jgi:hypothetical protein
MTPQPEELEAAVAAVVKNLEADVVLFNGGINRDTHDSLSASCSAPKHPNVFLILVSEGGDADAGYRMARSLQKRYTKVYVAISGYCKSAGTLVAIGAHELVISDDGELGPLDVQLLKSDELWEQRSGQTVTDAIDVLQAKSVEMFEAIMLRLKVASGGQITLKTAMQTATVLVTGLFKEIYSQIDPMYVGEVGRAMNIAFQYGQRLSAGSKNLREGSLDRLVSSYPSHGFVIDREEAATLFKSVREPSDDERKLINALGEHAREPVKRAKPLVVFLSGGERDNEDEESADESSTEGENKPGSPDGEVLQTERVAGSSGEGNVTEIATARKGAESP